MNAWIILLVAVASRALGDGIYPQQQVRYSFHVPQAPLGYSHPVGYSTSVHQAPFTTVYSIPSVHGPYLAPAPQVSVVHGPSYPFLAAGHTVYAAPQAAMSYAVQEPQGGVPPCRSNPHPTPLNVNAPTTRPPPPSAHVATPSPPPPSGINTHYKIPNPLSLLSNFAPPSVNAYYGSAHKEHPSSSQNLFSIGISTPKFDDEPYGH